jgi:hypothetical protein
VPKNPTRTVKNVVSKAASDTAAERVGPVPHSSYATGGTLVVDGGPVHMSAQGHDEARSGWRKP